MRKFILLFVLFVLLVFQANLQAQEQGKIEVRGYYHNLTNNRGEWFGEGVSFTLRQKSSTFVFEFMDGHRNSEESNYDGQTIVVGVYKDWSSKVYTFTAIQGSTSNPVFPRFRVYHRFNFKIGPKNRLIVGLGGGFVDYFDVNKVSYVTIGPTYYFPKNVIVSYRYDHYFNKLVDGNSYAHIASLQIRGKGKSRTRFWLSSGGYAYLGETIFHSFDVGRQTKSFAVQREQWLTKKFGITFEFEYTNYNDRIKNEEAFNRCKGGLRFFWVW